MTPGGTDLILLAGLWLTASWWDPVAAELSRLGHRPVAPLLPGVDDGPTAAGLEDQVAAVLAAVDVVQRPVVVGHSAASGLAWLAADRRPTEVAGVVLVGGFPSEDGSSYADFFPVVGEVMPFPDWSAFGDDDARDLDAAARAQISDRAVPVPAAVARARVTLTDERRFAVPVTLVCPEFTPDEARAWVASGELPELARAEQVSFVDLDSGHWPMITRPTELAQLLHRCVRERG